MIKLAKFIPEIKIVPQPNQKQPKIGRIYSIEIRDKEFRDFKVVKYDEYFKEFQLVDIKDPKNYNWYTKEEIEQHIENGEFKIISEIKIVPNTGKPRNNKELLKFITKNYQYFAERFNLIYREGYYRMYKLPLDIDPREIDMTNYRLVTNDGDENGSIDIVDIVLVDNGVGEQNGNLFLSLTDEIDYLGTMTIKGVKMYYDITVL